MARSDATGSSESRQAMRQKRSSDKDLAREIARLGDLTREELIERWIRAHGHPPSKGISRRLLELSAAYALQAKVFGGLKPSLRRALKAALDAGSPPSNSITKTAPIKPGGQLVRVWNGRTHHVEVVEKGFIWNGERFKSLTAIAYRITGARWSGPRFFGL
jgi:DUF2924 family protein